MRRDQETGLVLQNRSIDLNKIGLDEFVVLALDNHEGRIQDIESNMVSRDEVKNMMEKFKDDLLTKILAKEANI